MTMGMTDLSKYSDDDLVKMANAPDPSSMSDDDLRRAAGVGPEPASGMGAGFAATLSGMGQNLGAAMQGATPHLDKKTMLGPVIETDMFPGGRGYKTATGMAQIDPRTHVILNDPATNKPSVFSRDTDPSSIGARADAMGRVLGMGALATSPQGAAVRTPKVAEGAQTLRAEGVTLTPGQTAGGAWKRLEERMKSLPGVGDMIRNAENRASSSFNVAVANRVLEPIGQSLDKATKAGRDLIREVGDKIDDAYAAVVPKLRLNVDDQFMDDIAGIAAKVPEAHAKDFQNFVTREVFGRAPGDVISGDTLKTAQSVVKSKLAKYARAGGTEGEYGEALGELKDALFKATMRSTPEEAAALKNIDRAYAMRLRLERAGSQGGRDEPGQFSASQFNRAVREMSPSSGGAKVKRQFARGDAMMQDISEPAAQIMGNRVPDSGTAERGLLGLLLTGQLSSTAAMTGMALGLPYTPIGSRVASGLLANRGNISPLFVRNTGRARGLLGDGTFPSRALPGAYADER